MALKGLLGAWMGAPVAKAEAAVVEMSPVEMRFASSASTFTAGGRGAPSARTKARLFLNCPFPR